MNDLKFSCPSCGQHIRCEQTHAGEKIPCPGCASLIRVPTDADAEIVINTPVPPPNPFAPGKMGRVPTLEENFLAESGAPLPTNPPLTEREQEIAAARAAHVQAAGVVKPRLSFILSGGEAPIPEENESALSHDAQKHSGHPSSDAKTFHE